MPSGFVFALKGSRYVTHLKRLRDPETALANFFASGPLALGATLGPVLWQLPERLAFDQRLVDTFLRLLPHTTDAAAELAAHHDAKLPADAALTTVPASRPLRHALEPRHASFDSDAARDLLRAHRVAMVVADSAGQWPVMGDAATDFHYVRLHGEQRLYGADTARRPCAAGSTTSPAGGGSATTSRSTSTTTSTAAHHTTRSPCPSCSSRDGSR